MPAELWLVKPCPHGGKQGHHSYPTCDGESRVRLDPDELVGKVAKAIRERVGGSWLLDSGAIARAALAALSDKEEE